MVTVCIVIIIIETLVLGIMLSFLIEWDRKQEEEDEEDEEEECGCICRNCKDHHHEVCAYNCNTFVWPYNK